MRKSALRLIEFTTLTYKVPNAPIYILKSKIKSQKQRAFLDNFVGNKDMLEVGNQTEAFVVALYIERRREQEKT